LRVTSKYEPSNLLFTKKLNGPVFFGVLEFGNFCPCIFILSKFEANLAASLDLKPSIVMARQTCSKIGKIKNS